MTRKTTALIKRTAKEAKRANVLQLHASGLTMSAISRQVGMSPSGVSKLLKVFMFDSLTSPHQARKTTAVVHNSPRKGRPASMSKRYRRRLLALSTKHPFWSAQQLQHQMHDRMMKALTDRPAGIHNASSHLSRSRSHNTVQAKQTTHLRSITTSWDLQLPCSPQATADDRPHPPTS
jgi:transposase-like protein